MVSELESSLVSRLRACIKLAGSGNILAQKLGISRNTLENYLTSQSEPRLSTLQQIADLVGVRLAWLAAGDGHQFKGAASTENRDLVSIDPELMGKINDSISKTYREIGGRINPADMGRMAAKWYDLVVQIGPDPTERIGAVALLATQLKIELTTPSAADTNSRYRA